MADLRQKMQARRAARGAGQGEGAPAGGDGGQGGGSGGQGASGGEGRGRYAEAMKAELAPLRETLNETQRETLDAEFASAGTRKRAVIWTLERGRLKAVNVRVGVADGEHAEIIGDALKPGDVVVVGMAPAGA
jgi:hypothetical protein